VRTIEMLGHEPDVTAIPEMELRYEELLPSSLPLRKGTVLPNVREILEYLSGRSDVRSYLLTGNTRGGATAKLTHYRLIDFFPDGAFAEDAGERSTIAARALDLARQAGPVADDGVFVIGDTPHDIHCADAIGARTIAVGTGGYTVEELTAHRPWRIYSELPPVDEFIRVIDGSGVEPATRVRGDAGSGRA
jgi:phosphoglycolate phosphatase-like HAD superfamily hydrolase